MTEAKHETTADICALGRQGDYVRFAIHPKNEDVRRVRMSVVGAENLAAELRAALAEAGRPDEGVTEAMVEAFRNAMLKPFYDTAVGGISNVEWRAALEAARDAASSARPIP